jgi:hypothetical protein
VPRTAELKLKTAEFSKEELVAVIMDFIKPKIESKSDVNLPANRN